MFTVLLDPICYILLLSMGESGCTFPLFGNEAISCDWYFVIVIIEAPGGKFSVGFNVPSCFLIVTSRFVFKKTFIFSKIYQSGELFHGNWNIATLCTSGRGLFFNLPISSVRFTLQEWDIFNLGFSPQGKLLFSII